MHGPVERELSKLQDVLVHAAHHHRVHLDRLKPVGKRGVDAGERLLHASQAGDLGEAHGIERVERDVHAVEAGVAQRGRQAGEQRTVRGERDVLDLGDGADFLDERHDAVAHQRLASGEAHARDALAGH